MSDLLEYKCPCCGGEIEFNSSSQNMKCPYCDSEFDIELLKSIEEELQNTSDDNMQWKSSSSTWDESETSNINVYLCQSCGGEIVSDVNTVASKCPYCDNPVVIKGNISGILKPDYVIPFKLDKNAAKNAFKNHLKNKKLLPKVFKSENHIDEIKGIYVPFWLFNTDADAKIRYKACKVRHWEDSKYKYRESSYFTVIRAGKIGFDHIPVDGSTKMPDDLMESVEPFNYNEAVDFKTAYLSGYMADKYDVTVEQSVHRANERVKISTEQAFRNTISGFDSVVTERSTISLDNANTSYAMYPVWILNTTWRDKKYMFAMNGQTGKFVGNLPVDKGAFCRWFLGISAIASAITFGITSILWLI